MTRRERFKALISNHLSSFTDLVNALAVYNQIEFACCEDYDTMLLLAGLRRYATNKKVDIAVYEVMKQLR